MKHTQIIENERLRAQALLDAERTALERNALGQFATPPGLARSLAQYARSQWPARTKVRFFDPGIGTGSFFSALLDHFPAKSIAKAAGVELDDRFVREARLLWRSFELNVVRGDFTRQSPPAPGERFNLILTNPPYVRHHHIAKGTKEELQALVARRLGLRISGLAGLYCYFLLLAHDWLDEGGLSVWLIPSEFMDVNYGAAVKEYLSSRVTLLRVHRFDEADVQFADALVTSAVVVFRKVPPGTGDTVTFSYGGTLSAPATQETVPLTELTHSSRKWPRYPSKGRREREATVTLGDLFAIKRGIATGANEFFILERAEALSKGIPGEFLKPILPSPRFVHTAVVESDHDGYPKLERTLAVLDCPHPESFIRDKYPQLWAYLAQGKESRIHERYLTACRSPWYSQEVRPPAPFLCTYMGRSRSRPFRFLWNKSRAIAANVYLLLYPKEPLAAALNGNDAAYAAVLRHLEAITPASFIRQGRTYGGGLFKMEPRELARLDASGLCKVLDLRLGSQSRLLF